MRNTEGLRETEGPPVSPGAPASFHGSEASTRFGTAVSTSVLRPPAVGVRPCSVRTGTTGTGTTPSSPTSYVNTLPAPSAAAEIELLFPGRSKDRSPVREHRASALRRSAMGCAFPCARDLSDLNGDFSRTARRPPQIVRSGRSRPRPFHPLMLSRAFLMNCRASLMSSRAPLMNCRAWRTYREHIIRCGAMDNEQ